MTRALCCLLLAAGLLPAGELRSAEGTVRRILKRVRPAVVTVYTPNERDFDLTGAVVSPGGTIVTVRSLLLQGGVLPREVIVRFPGKGTKEAVEVIDEDTATDTVLLKPKRRSGGHLRTLAADGVSTGMWVLLVGNAFGAGRESTPTASLGVISGLVREGDRVVEVHASALVNPGSIGAPVVDLRGDLLGITAPRTTAAGGQTVLIPFERVRAAYREKGGPGARELSAQPTRRQPRKDVVDSFGLVVNAAARSGRRALVGVRAGGEPPEAGAKEPKPAPPVPGRRPAYDRCSGVIVGSDGLVVCPLRITGWPGPTRPLTVDLLDGRSFDALVLGTDERLRLALLSIEATGLPVLEPAAPGTVRAGRFAIALGFPHEHPDGGEPQVTAGILSRTNALDDLHPALRALQTDAGVAGGNRGGPLVDIDGRLLGYLLDVDDTNPQGYVTRRQGAYAGNAGLGFAVPVDALAPILPRLEEGEVFRAAFLGVSVETAEGGLRILAVTPKVSSGRPSPAAAAGLEKGDLLVSIDGRRLRKARDIRDWIAMHTVGDEVEIVYRRDGAEHTTTATLSER